MRVLAAPKAVYPVPMVDGNSPSIWVDGALRVYTSTGDPLAMTGTSIFNLRQSQSPEVTPRDHYPIWLESVWADADGTIYAWYHHEPGGVCPGGKLTAPKIGALVSTDGGQTFRDLGIVLETGDALNCSAANGFFAGGHGDFSVIPDRQGQYFYFLFGNYSGPLEHQGVAVARMALEDRANPVGAVRKYYQGDWSEPGLGGMVTPVYRAQNSWESSAPESWWGPAISWNRHLNAYVMVMNKTCCDTGWPQEGIYLAVIGELSDPGHWGLPVKILDAEQVDFAPAFYPQVVGIDEGDTDTQAGQVARLFVKGVSDWEIIFYTEDEAAGNGGPVPGPEPPEDSKGKQIPVQRGPGQ